jgi:hypothetical protein
MSMVRHHGKKERNGAEQTCVGRSFEEWRGRRRSGGDSRSSAWCKGVRRLKKRRLTLGHTLPCVTATSAARTVKGRYRGAKAEEDPGKASEKGWSKLRNWGWSLFFVPLTHLT